MANLTALTDTNSGLAFDAQGVARLRQAANENSPEALRGSAKQFEALFINMMLKSMRQATESTTGDSGHETQIYTSMFDQQISQMMAERGGIGLADMMLRQLQNKDFSVSGTAGAEAAVLMPTLSNGNQPNMAGTADSAEGMAYPVTPSHTDESVVTHFRQTLQEHATDAARLTGLPVSFILGQAALESGWGRRQIKTDGGLPSYNLFGIKAGSDWKGAVAEVVTTEYSNGVANKKVARFKAYASYAEAFRDYAQLLVKNPRYQHVLAQGQTVDGFAQGLQKAGYATDPAYADKLTRIIRRYLSVG
jgi:peptidoglycan hydrolase FlgJ